MNEAKEPDRIAELLRAGYAAPPPRAEFVRTLADRLEREAAQPALRLHADPTPARRRPFLPAALAASFLLAVTLTLLALRPARLEWNPSGSSRLGDVAFLGRDGRTNAGDAAFLGSAGRTNVAEWRFVSPHIRYFEAGDIDYAKQAAPGRIGNTT